MTNIKYDETAIRVAVDKQRILKGHTVEELSNALSMPVTTLRTHLYEKKTIPIHRVKTYCDYANIKVEDIIVEEVWA